MKNLDEMRRLARMARNIGQPDLELELAIEREENLVSNLFKKTETPTATPVLVENNLFNKESKVESGLVEQAAAAIKPTKASRESTQTIAISNEIGKLRQQLADVMARIGTMSWGGGGTGVVRFTDLDDHQNLYDVNSIHLNTTGPDANSYVAPGTLAWNPDEECLDVYQPDGTTLQVGLEQYMRVCNHSGVTLQHGTFVMFAGVEEPHDDDPEHTPIVVPFTADGVYPPLYTVGVLTETLANDEIGRVTTFGKVRHLDTTGSSVGETWQLGDLLWAHPTIPGGLTRVQPTAPNIAVSVAAVLHVSVTDGELLVRPTRFPQLHTGTFFSSVAQSAAQANTAYAVTWNGDGLKCPHINRANTSEIRVDHQGLYQFEFRLHLEAPKNQSGRVWIWARVNGVDVPESTTEISLFGSGSIEGRYYPSWIFVQTMNANESFQLMWATDNTNITIYTPAATAFAPTARPAAIRVTQVNL